MSKKAVLLAAGATALLWACSPETSEPAPAEPEAPAPAETPTISDSEPVASQPAPPTEPASDAPDEEPVRSAAPHVHGKANLAMVLDGSALTIELASPMYNLVGFEHAPETDEQQATIEAAEYKLMDPASLFVTNPEAGCAAQTDALEVKLGGNHEDDHGDHDHEGHEHDDSHEDADTHDHSDEAEHDEHDDHGHADHGHEHSGDHASTHKDAFLTYTFECANPEKLSPITVDLMSAFPNITEIEVVYLAGNTQDLFSLTPTNTEINLRP